MELFAASHLLPITSPPLAGGAIAVHDGLIVDVGPVDELKRRHGAPLIDFPGGIIMPGLVNAHSHLELTHFSSWKLRKGIDYSPRTYIDWIIQVIKIRRGLSREEQEQSVREGIRICLEAGTTAVGEILSERLHLSLYLASPLAGRIYFELLGHDPVHFRPLLAGVETAVDDFPAGPLQPGLAPHAPYTVGPRLMEEAAALARARRLPLSIHLAESREETSFMHDTSGTIAEVLYPFADWQRFLPAPRRTTSTACLDAAGLLGPGTTAVHCVHVTPADVEILRQRGVHAVLCPRSNDRLDVGRAPAALLKKGGIPLALGTDSLASNDSLSLWDEMRFALREFPHVFTPSDLLNMATIGGAGALRMSDSIGSLEKGKRADFLVLHLPAGSPADLAESLVEAGQLAEVFSGGARLT